MFALHGLWLMVIGPRLIIAGFYLKRVLFRQLCRGLSCLGPGLPDRLIDVCLPNLAATVRRDDFLDLESTICLSAHHHNRHSNSSMLLQWIVWMACDNCF